MGKKKGVMGELVCDIESPIVKYQIDNKEDSVLKNKTFIKFWKRGLRRKSFDRHIKSKLRKELKKFKSDLKKDKADLVNLRKKLRKCM